MVAARSPRIVLVLSTTKPINQPGDRRFLPAFFPPHGAIIGDRIPGSGKKGGSKGKGGGQHPRYGSGGQDDGSSSSPSRRRDRRRDHKGGKHDERGKHGDGGSWPRPAGTTGANSGPNNSHSAPRHADQAPHSPLDENYSAKDPDEVMPDNAYNPRRPSREAYPNYPSREQVIMRTPIQASDKPIRRRDSDPAGSGPGAGKGKSPALRLLQERLESAEMEATPGSDYGR